MRKVAFNGENTAEARLIESDDDDNNDDEFDEVEDENGAQLIYHSLCDPTFTFASLQDVLQYDSEKHGFDLLLFLPPALDDEFYEKSIVCINMCRRFVIDYQGEGVGAELSQFLSENYKSTKDENEVAANEKYYKPVLADDALLVTLDDLEDLKRIGTRKVMTSDSEKIADCTGHPDQDNDDHQMRKQLVAEVFSLRQQLERAKDLISTLSVDDDGSVVGGSGKPKPRVEEKQDNDTYYFSSYSSHHIHETMLQDKVRTEAYQKAILSNSESLFKDKVVLDIGCGTGVLSIFAAQAGASKIIAVDGSTVIHDARSIIDLNGFGGKIVCCQGMLEDLLEREELPLEPGERIDVIVSEWMGYSLTFETMLPSVIKARDLLMKPSGTMYPNCAQIFVEGASDTRLNYWNDVYGIDMSPMKARVAKELVQDAGVEVVDAGDIVTNRFELVSFDLNTCADSELDFSVPFILNVNNSSELRQGNTTKIQKLVVSFDIDFSIPGTNCVSFSTGCQTTPTHWKQTALWFDPLVGIPELSEKDTLRGQFKMGRNARNHREMDFDVYWETGRFNKDGDFHRNASGRIETKLGA